MISQHLARAALLGWALSLAPPAWAEPGPDPQASRAAPDPRPARELFAEGVGLAQRGQYAAAKAAFLRAYASEPHPRVLYNIGQCEVRLGQFGSAVEILERFLASDGISDDERRAVELQVEEIRTLVRGVSATAQLEEPRTPQRSEPPSPHPGVHADPALPPVDAPSHAWSWVLGGAGVALLGSAAALYLWNDARHDDWKVARAELDRVSDLPVALSRDGELWDRAQRSNEQLTSIQRVDVVTAVAAGVGAAAIGLGIWTWIGAREPASVALHLGARTELTWTGAW
jgi:tetratricopeptide (TPR) repeat protein